MEIGYGIFGTPHGLQCTTAGLISDIDIRKYIDLDGEKIDLAGNDQLFRARKIKSGQDIFLFYCQYSFAREMVSNRPGTFGGACVVVKNVQMSPEFIMGSLFELMINVKFNISRKSKRFLHKMDKVPFRTPHFLDFPLENFMTRSLEIDRIGAKKAGVAEKCHNYNQILAFFEMSTNLAFAEYNDLYCLWDKKGRSKIRYTKLKTILEYETFAKKAFAKKKSIKNEIKKALLERKTLDKEINQMEVELKTLQKSKKEFQATSFKDQNKLHLLKMEIGKIEKRINKLKINELQKLEDVKRLDNEIDEQQRMLTELTKNYALQRG